MRRSRIGFGLAVGLSAFGLAACGGSSEGEPKTVTELEPRPELTLKEKAGVAYGKVVASNVVYCEGKQIKTELGDLTRKIGEYSALRVDLLDEQTINLIDDDDRVEVYAENLNEAFPAINTTDAINCVNYSSSIPSAASSGR